LIHISSLTCGAQRNNKKLCTEIVKAKEDSIKFVTISKNTSLGGWGGEGVIRKLHSVDVKA
jgi:hypothetical protein